MIRHLTLFLAASIVSAQDTVVKLDRWTVHSGDNRAWAEPDFDDRTWEASDAPRTLFGQNRHHAGFRWYRATALLPPGLANQPLALALGMINEAYEVYVEGERVGRFGVLDPVPEGASIGMSASPSPSVSRGEASCKSRSAAGLAKE